MDGAKETVRGIRRRRWAVPALALMLVPAAACGGDDAAGAGTTTTIPAPETAPPADDPGAGDTGEDDRQAEDNASVGEDEPGDDAGLPVACDLLDDSEVEDLIGTVAAFDRAEAVAVDGLAYTECLWESDDGVTQVGVAVVEGRQRYDQRIDLYEDDFFSGAELIDGLGDGAMVANGVGLETTGATGGRTITILVGDLTVEVALRYPDQTPLQDVLDLSEIVLGRL